MTILWAWCQHVLLHRIEVRLLEGGFRIIAGIDSGWVGGLNQDWFRLARLGSV